MSKKTGEIRAVNRIVIGDVGSGKTIVAFLIALTYLKGLQERGQVVLLAPTEILAYQHYQNLIEFKDSITKQEDWFTTIFLTSKNIYVDGQKVTKGQLKNILTKKKKFSELFEGRSDCSLDKIFWVGTHALLHNELVEADMVLVDEQHRFGVKQRQSLAKSEEEQKSAHFVSFTATPIPRTLALTLYKNLKPNFLETLSDRNPIKTSVGLFEKLEETIIPKISNELSKGRKVYVICPRVEEVEDGEKDELWSVKKTQKLLEQRFPDQVLLAHGKMAEKKNVLGEFKESKNKNILVATTVVEVGVDVSQASLVVILNAERFGLAALHQIRGRVGRNDYTDNECVVVTYQKYQRAKRLRYLVEYSDGFELAEKDLELRGSGDLIGKIQSGFGNEIDQILGLNPWLYREISEEVSQLDLSGLSDLPRLKNYLEKQAKEVWEE